MAVSKCPSLAFSGRRNLMFESKISLVPSINSQYFQPYSLLQQKSEHTKPQRYIRSLYYI